MHAMELSCKEHTGHTRKRKRLEKPREAQHGIVAKPGILQTSHAGLLITLQQTQCTMKTRQICWAPSCPP